MKRPALLAPLALFALLAPPALFTWAGCSSDSTAGTTGEDPPLAVCSQAPLCDPIVLPDGCESDARTIVCAPGSADAGSGDAGSGDAGPGDAGPTSVDLSPTQGARLQCALEALRDRKSGGLSLLIADHGSPTCGVRFEVVSFGDGTTSVLPVAYCDLDISRGQAVRRALPPASFFDACLASASDLARLKCLDAIVTAKTAAGGTCSCRGIHDDAERGLCHER